MMLLDVNVVLATHREDHPRHREARAWIEDLLRRGDQFGVPATVWASFLRLSTNRRIFAEPTPLPDAFAFLRALRAQPGHTGCEPGERHVDLLQETCDEGAATSNLVPDAVLAALAREHGASLASFDRDFARFPNLTWVVPSPDV